MFDTMERRQRLIKTIGWGTVRLLSYGSRDVTLRYIDVGHGCGSVAFTYRCSTKNMIEKLHSALGMKTN